MAHHRLQVESLESREMLDSTLVISEFLASNGGSLRDEDGDSSDWIEVHNPSPDAIPLADWTLTDSPQQLDRWRFPNLLIEPGDYLVVFASGKDRRDPNAALHTNFRLRAAGEYLALVSPTGVVASDYAPQFPEQTTDVSFGQPDNHPQMPGTVNGYYFADPTPGEPNGENGFVGRLLPPTINVPAGIFVESQSIQAVASAAGADLRYTLDGSTPTDQHGTLVVATDPNQPATFTLDVDQTTTVRVATVREAYLSSPPTTRTYLFLDDVIQQSPDGDAPPGWPSGRINGQRLDYGMDPEIVNDPVYGPQLISALRDLPSFSIVTDQEHLFDRSTGIFVNAESSLDNGRSWERPASVELIHPDGSPGFQIDAGLRIRGGFSRDDDNPKHAFRLFFRSEYGPSKLRYPLFAEEGAQEFDNLDLRTAQVPSWSFCFPGRSATSGGCRFNTFLRDVFMRDTQRDMGQPYSRSRFYHLYLNGQYWGLFQTQERTEASYAATYFGGNPDDYDVIKVEAFPHHTVATDGNLHAWRQLWEMAREGFADDRHYYQAQGLNDDGVREVNLPVLLDVDNLVDYMIAILYGGNLDAPISNFGDNIITNNWFGIRDRQGDDGFRFFIHDAEWTLFDVEENRLGPWTAGNTFDQSNPQWLHQQLMQNGRYRRRFADRVYRHLTHGALSADRAAERLEARIAEIELAVIAESARWGDTHARSAMTQADWRAEVAHVRDYLPQRPAILIDQLREARLADGSRAALYPSTPAPEVLPDERNIATGTPISIDGAGDLYFTTNGSDPARTDATAAIDTVVGSDAALRYWIPESDELGLSWTATDFADEAWSTGTNGIGFQSQGSNLRAWLNTDVESEMLNVSPSIYVRIPFQYQGDAVDILRMTVQYDDGFVAYLNGMEVVRENVPDEVVWDSVADSSRRNSEVVRPREIDVSRFRSQLREGNNVLAIHGLNRATWSSDFLLRSIVDVGHVIDSGATPTAQLYSTPISIVADTKLNVRALLAGVWSVLVEVEFEINETQPGDVNRDGQFDSADLVRVFERGHYHDQFVGNSTWEDGDWNGDGEFDSADLVLAFQLGNFLLPDAEPNHEIDPNIRES